MHEPMGSTTFLDIRGFGFVVGSNPSKVFCTVNLAVKDFTQVGSDILRTPAAGPNPWVRASLVK